MFFSQAATTTRRLTSTVLEVKQAVERGWGQEGGGVVASDGGDKRGVQGGSLNSNHTSLVPAPAPTLYLIPSHNPTPLTAPAVVLWCCTVSESLDSVEIEEVTRASQLL